MSGSHHPIKVVVRRTGLSAHVLRIWEKRYRAVAPKRTGTNRRLYSEEQIERLNLLRTLTQAGHSIGQVAGLPADKLRKLAVNAADGSAPPPTSPSAAKSPNFLAECLAATRALDARGLETTLQRAEMELGLQGLLQRVVAPFAQRLGDLWRAGDLTAAHEHLATGVLRIFLGNAAKLTTVSPHDPVIVVVTPLGQVHELGALLAMAAAANLGWQVTYLGASLPAAEIAGAARQNRARVVALSLVYPEDDPRLAGELTRLRELLPPEVTVVAGGRAMPAYRKALDKLGVLQAKDLGQFCGLLDDLRQPKPPTAR
jgi:DNA-binding transcriptional MerR regulator/methylmalonyl-CoA mutase cobalamin-binding subunit